MFIMQTYHLLIYQIAKLDIGKAGMGGQYAYS